MGNIKPTILTGTEASIHKIVMFETEKTGYKDMDLGIGEVLRDEEDIWEV